MASHLIPKVIKGCDDRETGVEPIGGLVNRPEVAMGGIGVGDDEFHGCGMPESPKGRADYP